MSEIKSSDAAMAGQAQRIPAALKAQPGIMTAEIQIIRAGTGAVENHTLMLTPVQPEDQPKEAK